MLTKKELRKRYLKITLASTDPSVHDEAYKEFLVGLYRLGESQKVFQYLQAEPFQNGIEGIFAYLLGEITSKEFYDWIIEKCTKLYVNNLLKFRLISEEDILDLNDLYEESIFGAIKGLNTLEKISRRLHCSLKMSIEEKLKLRKQDRVAYIVWFNFLEKLHDRCGLPSVKEFTKHFAPGSIERIGHQILIGNDFSEFHLEPDEVKKYRQLCQL